MVVVKLNRGYSKYNKGECVCVSEKMAQEWCNRRVSDLEIEGRDMALAVRVDEKMFMDPPQDKMQRGQRIKEEA